MTFPYYCKARLRSIHPNGVYLFAQVLDKRYSKYRIKFWFASNESSETTNFLTDELLEIIPLTETEAQYYLITQTFQIRDKKDV